MTNNQIPPTPEKPSPDECCGSGCVPCIYDYYYDALEKWNERYGDCTQQSNDKLGFKDGANKVSET